MQFFAKKLMAVGLLVSAAVCLPALCSTSHAGHPHWRGSYYPGSFVGHHGLHYRGNLVHSTYYRSGYSSYGWDGYQPWGGSPWSTPWGASLSTVRTSVTYWPARITTRMRVRYPLVGTSWRARAIDVYAPVSYVAPTYCWSNWPAFAYVPPLVAAPLYYAPPHNCAPSIGAPTLDLYGDAAAIGDDVQFIATEPSKTSSPAQLVETAAGMTTETTAETLPASILSAADAIFRAGGYRQAAVAYAQLHVRYGSSDTIFMRRFVAQIACGDLDQAAVVLASAQGAGFDVRRWQTEHSDWNQLFADNPSLVEQLSERLAEHALAGGDEREGLEMMATWLNLTGQPQRADLFLAMTERLTWQHDSSLGPLPSQPADVPETPMTEAAELPAPRSKPSLVSLE